MSYHHGPHPETLARVETDGIGYEIAVRDDAPSGVAAFLVRLEVAASRSAIPTQLHLLFKEYEEAPVCGLQLDCYDPLEVGSLEDSSLVQSLLNRWPVRFEIVPVEPVMVYRLLCDPREERSRSLLVALSTAESYVVEFYDRRMTRCFTKRFMLDKAFRAAAGQVLARTTLLVPGEETSSAWERAKERFLRDVPM